MKIDERLKDKPGKIVVVTGNTGTGKSACIRGCPPDTGEIVVSETAGLYTYKRMHPDYKRLEIRIPETVKAFHDLITSYVTKRLDWIFLDTITRYYDLVWQEYLTQRKLAPDYCEYQIYRHCLHYFENLLHRLCDVADSGTDVFISCHLKKNEEGNDKVGKTVWYTPDLPGQLPERFARQVAVICRARKPRNLQGSYELYLPLGRDTSKDVIGIFDNGPVPNNFDIFLHGGRTNGTSLKASHSVSALEETSTPPPKPAPKPPTLLPPKRKEVEEVVEHVPDEVKIPRSQLKILELHRKSAGMGVEEMNTYCKETYGTDDPATLSIDDFVALTQHVSNFSPF